jgi:hypothetical protein
MVVLPNGESNHGSHANKIIQARLPEGHRETAAAKIPGQFPPCRRFMHFQQGIYCQLQTANCFHLSLSLASSP